MAQLARTSFRERIERLENESLSPLATRSYPAVRDEPEPDSDHRTPFQRDRDRIVHSKAFRRLKHKTQVFIAPEGDHYRTRLTHTLEACRIAYINHDIDDALRAGVLRFEDLPRDEIELLGSTGSERIETLVVDLLDRSEEAGDIVQGEEVGGAMLRLREFMFEQVYLGPNAQPEKPRIERLMRTLFEHYLEHPPPPLTPDAS